MARAGYASLLQSYQWAAWRNSRSRAGAQRSAQGLARRPWAERHKVREGVARMSMLRRYALTFRPT